ncbi:MAG: hypothetical protein ABJF10_05945 [Chthoniobacter sp.]|uniref:hypothetical protein n=1 Tax=Chthoniobacter sp. TaxID=2510640 RepID=UPI0032A5B73D
MRVAFHRVDLLRTALEVKGASSNEIEETLSAIRQSAEASAFDAWNSELSAKERQILSRMLSPGGEILSGRYLSLFARTFINRFGLPPESMERWFKARFWGRN